MSTPVWIGLGSNLGDRKGILGAAVASLAETPGVVVKDVSPYHETQPVGGPPGQGPFLNAAAHLETTLDPHQLLAVLQGVENEEGRVRVVRWGERTLDLDILIFGTRFLDTPELKLPHPRLALRRFVLEPLAEIAPSIVDTMTRRTIADLLANLDRGPRYLAIEGAVGRSKSEVFRRLVEDLPAFGISEAELEDDSDEQGDPDIGPLERKGRAIRASTWASETLRVPWIVSDYCLPWEILRAAWSDVYRRHRRSGGVEGFREEMRRARIAQKEALLPTLVLVLPGEHEEGPRPGRLPFPQLWPESDKPDAILAEVLATCRGIEGP